MQLFLNCKARYLLIGRKALTFKTLLALKLLFTFLVAFSLQSPARSYSQGITLKLKDAPLEKVFKLIEQQTKFRFVYSQEAMTEAKPVSIEVNNESLENVLRLSFTDQPLGYSIQDNFIIIKVGEKKKVLPPATIDIRGKVVNENNEPLAGVTITASKSNKATATNEQGEFYLKDINENDVLIVTSVGYYKREIPVNGQSYFAIQLKMAVGSLDEMIIMAYGKTSRRINTGDINKVSAEELGKQPVSNPLLALQGRVPGLEITQSSGLNGAAVKVQLRGQSSILQGSEPLYIVDGIPYVAGNVRLNQITNATDEIGMSPFSLIDLENIGSIEILKDADATAIYGSRGANGVILITTKKGDPGKTKFNAKVNTGNSKVTRTMDMLNTHQYVQMRREAFVNDGLTPSADPSDPGYAPDIMLWDSTRYTDLKKLLIGGTAHSTDAEVSCTGGSLQTQFLLAAGYQRQTTVFPTNLGETKISAHFNLNHISENKKLTIRLNGNFVSDENELNGVDLTSFINLPPNIKLYDEQGKINWGENNVLFNDVIFRQNPIAALKTTYDGKFKNLISSLQVDYRLLNNLQGKINFGYNILQENERSSDPSISIDPNSGNLPDANFANSTQISWIAEPQLEYLKSGRLGTITALVGSTWQENRIDGISVQAFNYASDLLLGSVSGAGTVNTTNSFNQYRYTAFFGRLTYNLKDRYILNISGRRDGSSRFGPNERFSNFGAAGGACIFSNMKLFQNSIRFISFGKIRGSYGVTGNDQIGDYKYLDTWTASSNTYQGVPVTNPSSLFNPDFSWERNKKLEFALELGFFKDRVLFSGSYYRNRSGNQLINYTLPIQTGFNSVLKNLDALLQNKGTELQVTTKNFVSKSFSWTTSINFTSNRNKLLAFPGLSTSSYSNTYFTGKSVSTRKLYKYLGVDPNTGLYKFEDVDGNGLLDRKDQINYVNTDPKFYGGVLNSLQYKQLSISILLEFKKQKGYNYLSNNSSIFTPGYGLVNQPVVILGRWQKPGDETNIQKFTASSSSDAFNNTNIYIPSSDANISDASFIRCKNISASYELPSKAANSIKAEKCTLYIYAQNLFTITKYKGADPETQNMFVLPPLKTIVIGIQITF